MMGRGFAYTWNEKKNKIKKLSNQVHTEAHLFGHSPIGQILFR